MPTATPSSPAQKKRSTGGFALPLALGVGALGLGAAGVMAMRSGAAAAPPPPPAPPAPPGPNGSPPPSKGDPLDEPLRDTTAAEFLQRSGGFKDQAHFDSTMARLAKGRGEAFQPLTPWHLSKPVTESTFKHPPFTQHLGGMTRWVINDRDAPIAVQINTDADPHVGDATAVRAHEGSHVSTVVDPERPSPKIDAHAPLDPREPYHSGPSEIMAFGRQAVREYRLKNERDPLTPAELTQAAEDYIKAHPSETFKEMWNNPAARKFFLENGQYIAAGKPAQGQPKVAVMLLKAALELKTSRTSPCP